MRASHACIASVSSCASSSLGTRFLPTVLTTGGVGARLLYPNRQKPSAGSLFDDERETAVDGKMFAWHRDTSEQTERVSADAFEILRREVETELLVHIIYVHTRVDDDVAIARFLDLRRQVLLFRIIFVHDLADDLFQKVFHRHEAGRSAVLVDDDRHRNFLRLHLAHQFVYRLVLRNSLDGTHNRTQERMLFVARDGEQEFPIVDDSHDVVDVLFVDRDFRVTFPDDELDAAAHRILDVCTYHIRSRSHHLAHDRVAELEDGVDHLLFFFFERAVRLPDAHERFDVILGHVRPGRVRVAPEQTYEPIREPDERPRYRAEQAGHEVEERRHAAGPVRRLLDDDHLRQHFREDEHDDGHGGRRDEHRFPDAVLDGRPCRERIRREQDDRIADEDRRQEVVAIRDEALEALRLLALLVLEQAQTRKREQRAFGRCEARCEKHEQGDDHQRDRTRVRDHRPESTGVSPVCL